MKDNQIPHCVATVICLKMRSRFEFSGWKIFAEIPLGKFAKNLSEKAELSTQVESVVLKIAVITEGVCNKHRNLSHGKSTIFLCYSF